MLPRSADVLYRRAVPTCAADALLALSAKRIKGYRSIEIRSIDGVYID
ncbi:hypothetical protein WN990_20740 [Kitasatospora purpeofusca]